MKNIKTLTEENYDAIFSLSQFAFQYELSEEEMHDKKEEVKRHKVWGWMDGDNLAAKLHLIPLSCYINGKIFNMGGISAVATWPEYRRQGMVKDLLHHSLKYMKENGQIISYLHPFSFRFYRKYGWEHAFNELQLTLPINKLKKKWDAKGYVRRIQPDVPLLHHLYTNYAKSFNGMLERDEKWWEQRVLNRKHQIAVAYNEQDQAEGYVLFKVKDNVVKITELVHSNLNGWKLLLGFIANHDSMAEKVKMVVPENDKLSLLLDEPRFEQKLEPYFMARIVDVQKFLQEYPFAADEKFAVTILDDFFPENNGTYQVRAETGVNSVSHIQSHKGNGIQCSIQVLTGMLLGFKRPNDYHELELLQGDEAAVVQLERLIPENQAFFADFF
ncbi:GNAT family N-acetyltransferase [Virgibacillus indicus]|uniref:GNAT family N-acetyltransferase n=1 Tax=Virgibacillus indicus TaxID=2024554 RepID=UPI001F0AEC12|nr:GNAT family N-acetyltransferase [Virgibacillus indicus]